MDSIETVALYGLVLIGGIVAVAFGRHAWRGLFPGRWQAVPARVVRAYVESTRDTGATRHAAMVEYAYRFGAHDYRGRGTVFGNVTCRRSAEDALAPYPVDQVLMVAVYRPDPRESRMFRSESVMAVVGTLFGTSMVAFAAWMLAHGAS